jgi:hypothetical protein
MTEQEHHGHVLHDDGRYRAICAGCGPSGPWRRDYIVACQDLSAHIDGQQRLDVEPKEDG